MCQDNTDKARIQGEGAAAKGTGEKASGAGLIYSHIAQALARGYMYLYYVNIDTDEYIEYHTGDDFGALAEIQRGADFFERCRREAGGSSIPRTRRRSSRPWTEKPSPKLWTGQMSLK